MDDEQIEILMALLITGQRLAWFSGREYREIVRIELRREPHEGPEECEPAGTFENGEYCALYIANPEDIVLFDVRPVFSIEAEE